VNAIGNVGSLERMIGAFQKVGVCPFTRQCLQDESVCHAIIINVDGDADDGGDA
jgi:hypothetical protein